MAAAAEQCSDTLSSDPSIRPFSFISPSCLRSPEAFSSLLLSGCSFEAMNSVSIKGLLKAPLRRRPSLFLPLKAENTLGDHWERRRWGGGMLKTFVFPIHETIAGKIKRPRGGGRGLKEDGDERGRTKSRRRRRRRDSYLMIHQTGEVTPEAERKAFSGREELSFCPA